MYHHPLPFLHLVKHLLICLLLFTVHIRKNPSVVVVVGESCIIHLSLVRRLPIHLALADDNEPALLEEFIVNDLLCGGGGLRLGGNPILFDV